ncbi:hypothetical protein BJ508DRAFT_301514 [Ascobolus immersus RN42]|uniref:Uncharacterized protein n=1 Tax=Ascobolus immersus RN42 TaxID=1160509 RepID=A0A3N4IMR3_ASCIM|nr:hypothetical protein BJ508DRAFT_301514 [Ascobolus immersus RN42]
MSDTTPTFPISFRTSAQTVYIMNNVIDIIWDGVSFGQVYQYVKICEKLKSDHPNGLQYLRNLQENGCLLPGDPDSPEWTAALEAIMAHPCITTVAEEIIATMDEVPNSACCGWAIHAAGGFETAAPELSANMQFAHDGHHGLGLVRNEDGIVVFDSSAAEAIWLNKHAKTSSSNAKVFYTRSPFKTKGRPTTFHTDTVEFPKISLRASVMRREVVLFLRTQQQFDNLRSTNGFTYLFKINFSERMITLTDSRLKGKARFSEDFPIDRNVSCGEMLRGLECWLELMEVHRIVEEKQRDQLRRNIDCLVRLSRFIHSG